MGALLIDSDLLKPSDKTKFISETGKSSTLFKSGSERKIDSAEAVTESVSRGKSLLRHRDWC